MWTPFPLTTQLVGLNLLKKCEGAYVIMTIRISPMPGLASLVAEAKKRRRGDVDRFFLLLYTKSVLAPFRAALRRGMVRRGCT